MKTKIKQCLGMALQLLGLASVVDGYIAWRGFFYSIVERYIMARDFLFAWIPFEIPSSTKDYLVVGIGVATANIHSGVIWEEKEFKEMPKIIRVVAVPAIFLIVALFWPLFLFGVAVVLLVHALMRVKKISLYDTDVLDRQWAIHMVFSSLKILIILTIALFLFSDVKSKLL